MMMLAKWMAGWYYRHIVSGEYREFPSQNHLIPLSKNRPKDP